MKTVIVLSDSHGRRGAVDRLAPLFAENDYIIHLGDGSSDMRETFSRYPDKTFVMKGNCDFSYGISEHTLEAEGVKLLLCHGHKYGVKSTLAKLAARAKELDCDVALYGHTHVADVREVDGVLCVCPGSAGAYADASYCYLVLHKGKATPTIVPLK